MYEHDGLQILAFSCIIIQLEASRTKHTHTHTNTHVRAVCSMEINEVHNGHGGKQECEVTDGTNTISSTSIDR